MNKRKKLDNVLYARTRKWAYERDNGQIVFRSQMGLSNLKNLACLCRDCHNKAHGEHAKEIREILIERNEGVEWPNDE